MSHCIQSWAHSSQMAYSMAGSDRYAEPNEWQHGKTTAFKLGISKKPRVKDHVRPQRGSRAVEWPTPYLPPRGEALTRAHQATVAHEQLGNGF